MDSRSKKTTCVVFFAPSGLCIKKDMCVLITQSCPTLCDPLNCSLPGSSVLGILQARVLEWVAIFFSRGSSRPWISYTAGRFFTTESPGKPWNPILETWDSVRQPGLMNNYGLRNPHWYCQNFAVLQPKPLPTSLLSYLLSFSLTQGTDLHHSLTSLFAPSDCHLIILHRCFLQ